MRKEAALALGLQACSPHGPVPAPTPVDHPQQLSAENALELEKEMMRAQTHILREKYKGACVQFLFDDLPAEPTTLPDAPAGDFYFEVKTGYFDAIIPHVLSHIGRYEGGEPVTGYRVIAYCLPTTEPELHAKEGKSLLLDMGYEVQLDLSTASEKPNPSIPVPATSKAEFENRVRDLINFDFKRTSPVECTSTRYRVLEGDVRDQAPIADTRFGYVYRTKDSQVTLGTPTRWEGVFDQYEGGLHQKSFLVIAECIPDDPALRPSDRLRLLNVASSSYSETLDLSSMWTTRNPD